MSVGVLDRRRDSLTPALAAAAALHALVFVLALWLGRPPYVAGGTAVPITIVASGPTTDSRPAEAAPETQTAQTEQPTPAARAPSPPPAPAPVPVPTPKITPEKTTAKPAPQPRPAPDTFSLDKLAAAIARTTHPSPPRPAFAARGPARAETAPVARVDAGQGVAQSDIAGLSQLLERLWNPNCAAVAGEGVVIPVKFQVGDDGRVVGRITQTARDTAADPVTAAAARRAIDAVRQAEPYGEVYRGKAFTVNFDAKTACANR